MPYDEHLAGRIRELLADEPAVTEQRMFGGLAFLLGGNMSVAVSGQGGALVRVEPVELERLVATTNAEPMEMRGRPMRGWVRIDSNSLRTKRELARWVRRGIECARALPPKSARR